MSAKNEQGRAAVILAFYEEFARDHEAGKLRDLEDYQTLWPGFEDVVAEEYRAAISDVQAEAGIEDAASGRIAHYRIEGEIGRGAQGFVYRAKDERLDRTVALKVFRRVLGDGVRARLRFQREARAASRLDHPGICTVYDSGVDGSSVFMAMRFVPGTSLAHRISESAAPPSGRQLRETVEMFSAAASALHAAHESGLLHRDLKPGNLMVTPEGHLVILDFGLASGLDLPSLTATGEVFGTPAYMPPEQLKDGSGSVDRRADVYALGVSLYEAVTLRRPHGGDDLQPLYRSILSGEKEDPRALNPAISRDLAVVIETATEPERERRYQSAAVFAEDLRRVALREPILARPAPGWLRTYRWMERNPVAATALLGALVVTVTAFGILPGFFRESPQEQADRQLGTETRRVNQVEDLIQRGFQIGFGADPLPARALFDRAGELAPDDPTVLAGRVLLEMPDTDTALAILDGADRSLRENSDILWLRGVVLRVAGREVEAQEHLNRAGASTGDLRAFLEGHFAVRNFMPPVRVEEAERALEHFEEAVMRSTQPRFHHYHSMMMAAHRAGNEEAMAEAERALVHHWPESQATWEAIAQFYFPTDRDKAVDALRHILELGPSATAHLGLARHAETTGDTDAALQHYRDALAVNAELASAHLMQGDLLTSLDRQDDALQSYVNALRFAEGFMLPACRESLLQALASLDDHQRTVATLETLVVERPVLKVELRDAVSRHFSGDDLQSLLEALDR